MSDTAYLDRAILRLRRLLCLPRDRRDSTLDLWVLLESAKAARQGQAHPQYSGAGGVARLVADIEAESPERDA